MKKKDVAGSGRQVRIVRSTDEIVDFEGAETRGGGEFGNTCVGGLE